MTRITDFGIKRTYVQAGFSDDNTAVPSTTEVKDAEKEGKDERPQKKRKRVRTRKAKNVASSGEGVVTKEEEEKNKHHDSRDTKSVESRIRSKDRQARRQASTEQRRIRRIQERNADTTCFLCRKRGHAAKSCRTGAKTEMEEVMGRSVMGICYRCGSTRHNLSRCKNPVDEFNPLPYASCFVCHNKGHLASTCPHNKDKGVYPNGGSCKLCGETSHLARDCGLRKQDSAKASLHLGTGRDAGADEDDFHVLKRRNREVELEEKREAKVKKREVESKVVQF